MTSKNNPDGGSEDNFKKVKQPGLSEENIRLAENKISHRRPFRNVPIGYIVPHIFCCNKYKQDTPNPISLFDDEKQGEEALLMQDRNLNQIINKIKA